MQGTEYVPPSQLYSLDILHCCLANKEFCVARGCTVFPGTRIEWRCVWPYSNEKFPGFIRDPVLNANPKIEGGMSMAVNALSHKRRRARHLAKPVGYNLPPSSTEAASSNSHHPTPTTSD